MNRAAFFASLRSRTSGIFGTSPSQAQAQVQDIEAILNEAERRGTPLKHLAYIPATPYLETGGKMQPIRKNLNYLVDGLSMSPTPVHARDNSVVGDLIDVGSSPRELAEDLRAASHLGSRCAEV